MGGRGSGGAVTVTETRGHLDPNEYLMFDDKVKQVQEELGINRSEAEAQVRAIKKYTEADYHEIRVFERKDSSYEPIGIEELHKERSEALTNYTENAPSYGGEVYRGTHLPSEMADEIAEEGAIIDMGGTSSWTSDKHITNNFNQAYSDRETSITFTHKDIIEKGASVAHMAKFPHEEEVLVSKNAQFRVTNVTETDDGYEIELEEV